MVKKVVAAVVVLTLVVGGVVWFTFLRDDPEPELSLDSGSDADATAGADSADPGEAPESFDGTWTVQTGGDTTAGFRIDESFAGGLADHTAVGRSPEVSGSIQVEGTTVTEGSFTVDLTAIEFTDDPGIPVANRVRAMENRGLETSRFPEATFTLTGPVELNALPEGESTVAAEAVGELTLHGVTREVTIPVEIGIDGATVRIVTADPVPIVLADFDIEKPTGGPIADIADEGSFEFLIELTQG